MVQLTRTLLHVELIEDIVVWKTNASVRLDYNNGVEKHITLVNNSLEDGHVRSEAVKYEIHPETREHEYNEIKCHLNQRIKGNTTMEISNSIMLPPLEGKKYVFVGFQLMYGTNTSKYERIYTIEDAFVIKETTWAVYEKLDDDSFEWTPIRYEFKGFNEEGILREHTVFEYLHFYAGLKYIKNEVFDIKKLGCENVIIHDSNSDSITKNLMFINPEEPEHVDHVLESFKSDFQRQYNDGKEHTLRRNIIQNSMRLVSSVNKKNLGYKLSINEFADRTPQEMQRHTGLLSRPHGKSGNIPFPYIGATLKAKVDELPETYDMRLLGLISPVKNQGECGSCWALGPTATVEGALAKVYGGRLVSLASQALIDCGWDYANGCKGGSETDAYEWMMKYGLPTEEEYGSYTMHNGYCNIRNMTKIYPIRGYTDVTPFSTSSLKVALVNHGPVTVFVHVTESFKLYSSGIYYDPDCVTGNRTHSVTLVGYSEKDGELFWILKNTWGSTWGIDGYMHISARDNNCGVESRPSYAVI